MQASLLCSPLADHLAGLDPSGPVTTSSEEKPIEEVEKPMEEVEQLLPISKFHYLKDNRFSSTGIYCLCF